MLSSEMWYRVDIVYTDVSEERIAAHVGSSFADFYTLKMEAINFSEASVYTYLHGATSQKTAFFKLFFIHPAELTQCYRALDKLTDLLILNKYTEYYRFRSLIPVFTRTRHWFLS
jgi:hypothetical protein